MSVPLAPGHVLVRLTDGGPTAADAVLDRLEAVFPTHTGRGRTRLGNPWDDPPTLTSEGTWTIAAPRPDGAAEAVRAPGPAPAVSQTFDVSTAAPASHGFTAVGGITADLLGTPDDVTTMLHALAALGPLSEEHRDHQGPLLAVQLRLGGTAGSAP
ncbi:hypothetical protein [Streptomyces rubellomurinus]|uniref:Uncharacterized protein n=1 Tax=Streptomyces rubellomurinus (strain ATCC 31215) TaxID=359131 RepID=A0A0F2T9G0_STRR3|nr:hypothetical protein [Streptomyces rubellomurinus]KJS59864.1 hypothetical protein VM95_24755 [Streptomyces rubellomurinus]